MPETTTTTTKPKANATKTAQFSSAVREEVVASVKQAQQFTLDAVSAWVDAVGKIYPELPTFPFVPGRADVVESVGAVFEVAEELLALEHKFAADLANVLVPAS